MDNCCGPNGRMYNPRPMQKGSDGKSAYDIWKENQASGADTSLEAYLASMKGKDGAPGKDGGSLDTKQLMTMDADVGYIYLPAEAVTDETLLKNKVNIFPLGSDGESLYGDIGFMAQPIFDSITDGQVFPVLYGSLTAKVSGDTTELVYRSDDPDIGQFFKAVASIIIIDKSGAVTELPVFVSGSANITSGGSSSAEYHPETIIPEFSQGIRLYNNKTGNGQKQFYGSLQTYKGEINQVLIRYMISGTGLLQNTPSA